MSTEHTPAPARFDRGYDSKLGHTMLRSRDGEYVLASDYDALLATVAPLIEALERIASLTPCPDEGFKPSAMSYVRLSDFPLEAITTANRGLTAYRAATTNEVPHDR